MTWNLFFLPCRQIGQQFSPKIKFFDYENSPFQAVSLRICTSYRICSQKSKWWHWWKHFHNFALNIARISNPINIPGSNYRHIQQPFASRVIDCRTITIIFRTIYQLSSYRVLVNVVQLLVEIIVEKDCLSIIPVLPKLVVLYSFIVLSGIFKTVQQPFLSAFLWIRFKRVYNLLAGKFLKISQIFDTLFSLLLPAMTCRWLLISTQA